MNILPMMLALCIMLSKTYAVLKIMLAYSSIKIPDKKNMIAILFIASFLECTVI